MGVRVNTTGDLKIHTLEFVNLTDWRPPRGFWEAVRRSFERVGIDPEGITVAFVDEDYMASLKGRYFGERKPSDVLTFRYNGVREVVICPSFLKHDEYEIARRIFHGVLHALGYDHKVRTREREMERLETALMEGFKDLFGV